MIIAHNNPEILRKLLSLYDDNDIDFYIHIDKKSDIDFGDLQSCCQLSRVNLVDRMDVQWTHDSLMKVELHLLKEAKKGNYDVYHLISGVDFPIVSKDKFLNFFEINKGKEFVEFAPIHLYEENKIIDRVRYKHILLKNLRTKNALLRKSKTAIRLSFLKIQKLFHVDRFASANIPLHYGSNWFSIRSEFTEYVLSKEDFLLKYFSDTFCSDELFIQTLLFSSPFYKNNFYNDMDQTIPKGRYIDWKRGSPYTFKESDFDELIHAENCVFARKFSWQDDKDIVIKLEEYLRGSQ